MLKRKTSNIFKSYFIANVSWYPFDSHQDSWSRAQLSLVRSENPLTLTVSPRADLFLSALSCNKKEEKNHQTSHFERAHPFQSTRQLWARAPLSINQATLSERAPFSHQDKNSTISTLHNTWPGTSFFYLPQQLTPPSSPTPRTNGPTYPSTPFEHGILWCGLMASIRPSSDITNGQKEVKIAMVDTSVHEST